MKGGNLFSTITNNWPAKVLAVIMALFLYIFQQMNGITSARFDVPLSRLDNTDLVSTTQIPAKVRITISGTNDDISTITENDVMASIDLTAYEKPGEYNVPVKIKSAENARSFDLFNVTVTPGEVKLSLDKRAGKYFAVEPLLKGIVAPGYELVQSSVIPKQIYVEGPQTLVDQIKVVNTEVIDITGRDSSLTRNIKITELGPSLSAHENTVQFNATIKSIDLMLEYQDLSIAVTGLDARFKTEAPSVKGVLKLEGNELAIQTWKPSPNTLYIDCSQIMSSGEYKIPVMITLPENFTVLHFEPEFVTITVSAAK